ncbi:MAG: hypothetical protein ACREL5_08130 [Gemmatimonadales bacterium]
MTHGIRVLWIGHSTTLIQTPQLKITIDFSVELADELARRRHPP